MDLEDIHRYLHTKFHPNWSKYMVAAQLWNWNFWWFWRFLANSWRYSVFRVPYGPKLPIWLIIEFKDCINHHSMYDPFGIYGLLSNLRMPISKFIPSFIDLVYIGDLKIHPFLRSPVAPRLPPTQPLLWTHGGAPGGRAKRVYSWWPFSLRIASGK